jgi:hypothetical protein
MPDTLTEGRKKQFAEKMRLGSYTIYFSRLITYDGENGLGPMVH